MDTHKVLLVRFNYRMYGRCSRNCALWASVRCRNIAVFVVVRARTIGVKSKTRCDRNATKISSLVSRPLLVAGRSVDQGFN